MEASVATSGDEWGDVQPAAPQIPFVRFLGLGGCKKISKLHAYTAKDESPLLFKCLEF